MEIVSLTKAFVSYLVNENGLVTCENALSLYFHNLEQAKGSPETAMKTSALELADIFASKGKGLQPKHITRRLKTILS